MLSISSPLDNYERRAAMGMTDDGLSYWQAEAGGISLFEMTPGELLDRRASEIPTQEALVYSRYGLDAFSPFLRRTEQEYRRREYHVARVIMPFWLNKTDHLTGLISLD